MENFANKSDQTNKELIFFLITLVFFVFVLAIYLFFFLKKSTSSPTLPITDRPDTPFYQLEPTTQVITQTTVPIVEAVLTDLDFAGDFRPMGWVLKGYADSFHRPSNELKVKNQLSNSTTLQLLSFNTSQLQSFFCWPNTLPSQTGPVDIRTVEHGLSSPDAIIYNPDEKNVPFEQLEIFLQPDSFVIMQLTKEFNYEQPNFIKKLILIGC